MIAILIVFNSRRFIKIFTEIIIESNQKTKSNEKYKFQNVKTFKMVAVGLKNICWFKHSEIEIFQKEHPEIIEKLFSILETFTNRIDSLEKYMKISDKLI